MSLSDQIPANTRVPGAYIGFNNQRAQQNLAPWVIRILYLGQATTDGVGPVSTPIQLFQPTDGWRPFGRGSMLDRMIQAGFGCNATTEAWAMSCHGLDGGVAAQYVTAITSAPTADGTLAFYIGGQAVSVQVLATMTAANVATALASAINASEDLPVSANAVGSNVDTKVNWQGLTGNDIDFRLNMNTGDVTPAGLALNTTISVNGAGVPDINSLIDGMAGKQYQVIVCPWTDEATLSALATELASRRGALQQMDGLAYSTLKGSQGSIAAFGEGLNSPDLSIFPALGPVTTYERAARIAATIAYYGALDPARPFQTLVLTGDIAESPSEALTWDERNALLNDGIATTVVDDGGNVTLERPITTYQTNEAGAPDTSYLDVTTMMTLSYSRYAWRQRYLTKFPRSKLADGVDPVPQGQPIVTPKTILAELVAFGRDMEAVGLWQDIDSLKALSYAAIDATDASRLDLAMMPNFVSGLRVLNTEIDFGF